MSSTEQLKNESLTAWSQNAAYWDDSIGQDGNLYWQRLQEPSLQRLVFGAGGVAPGFRALDLCTGNGIVARWLVDPKHSTRAAEVMVTDGCLEMVRRAKARWVGGTPTLASFAPLDVCDREALDPGSESAKRLVGVFGALRVYLPPTYLGTYVSANSPPSTTAAASTLSS